MPAAMPAIKPIRMAVLLLAPVGSRTTTTAAVTNAPTSMMPSSAMLTTPLRSLNKPPSAAMIIGAEIIRVIVNML